MKRREFIGLVSGAAVWPLAAQGQQSAIRVIGVLALESLARTRASLAPAQRRLAEMGYVEGQNLAFEYRAADNQEDRLAALVGDLVQRRVSVIVAPQDRQSLPPRLPPHPFQSFSLRGLTRSQVGLSRA